MQIENLREHDVQCLTAKSREARSESLSKLSKLLESAQFEEWVVAQDENFQKFVDDVLINKIVKCNLQDDSEIIRETTLRMIKHLVHLECVCSQNKTLCSFLWSVCDVAFKRFGAFKDSESSDENLFMNPCLESSEEVKILYLEIISTGMHRGLLTLDFWDNLSEKQSVLENLLRLCLAGLKHRAPQILISSCSLVEDMFSSSFGYVLGSVVDTDTLSGKQYSVLSHVSATLKKTLVLIVSSLMLHKRTTVRTSSVSALTAILAFATKTDIFDSVICPNTHSQELIEESSLTWIQSKFIDIFWNASLDRSATARERYFENAISLLEIDDFNEESVFMAELVTLLVTCEFSATKKYSLNSLALKLEQSETSKTDIHSVLAPKSMSEVATRRILALLEHSTDDTLCRDLDVLQNYLIYGGKPNELEQNQLFKEIIRLASMIDIKNSKMSKVLFNTCVEVGSYVKVETVISFFETIWGIPIVGSVGSSEQDLYSNDTKESKVGSSKMFHFSSDIFAKHTPTSLKVFNGIVEGFKNNACNATNLEKAISALAVEPQDSETCIQVFAAICRLSNKLTVVMTQSQYLLDSWNLESFLVRASAICLTHYTVIAQKTDIPPLSEVDLYQLFLTTLRKLDSLTAKQNATEQRPEFHALFDAVGETLLEKLTDLNSLGLPREISQLAGLELLRVIGASHWPLANVNIALELFRYGCKFKINPTIQLRSFYILKEFIVHVFPVVELDDKYFKEISFFLLNGLTWRMGTISRTRRKICTQALYELFKKISVMPVEVSFIWPILDDAHLVPKLVSCLGDRDPDIRMICLKAWSWLLRLVLFQREFGEASLEWFKHAGKDCEKQIQEILVESLDDSENSVRIACALTLQSFVHLLREENVVSAQRVRVLKHLLSDETFSIANFTKQHQLDVDLSEQANLNFMRLLDSVLAHIDDMDNKVRETCFGVIYHILLETGSDDTILLRIKQQAKSFIHKEEVDEFLLLIAQEKQPRSTCVGS